MYIAQSFNLSRQVLTNLHTLRLRMAVKDVVRAKDARGAPGVP
jgi:hypothetical protein